MEQRETGNKLKRKGTILIAFYKFCITEVYNLNGKSNTLLADGAGGNRQKKLYQDGRCRKMTPLEYERCQTIPDNYSDCISDSARYSAIGNGWTVDIIAHIFSYIPKSDIQ